MSETSTRVALTGGTGFLGSAVIEEAALRGISLNALARRNLLSTPAVTWIRGDLADLPALDRMMAGAEAVIHVAGVVNAPDPAGFQAGNVDGTAAVLEAAKASGVRRFIFVSSLSAREPQLSAYGASKARAEELVKASGLDWTIVRPPGIYGPRDHEQLDLFRAARLGVVPMPKAKANGGGRASVIHVGDLARLLLDLIPGGEAVTHCCFEPDDGRENGWDHGEFARAIGAAVGRKRVWVLRLPGWAMRFAARADGLLRGPRAKLTLDRASYMMHPDWVVSAEARPPVALWQPRIATREGLARTAEWYREQGLL